MKAFTIHYVWGHSGESKREGEQVISIFRLLVREVFKRTRASCTTGAKGSNSFARDEMLQITDDHMERIRLHVSANHKQHVARNR